VIHKSFIDMDLRRMLWPRPTKGGPGLSGLSAPALNVPLVFRVQIEIGDGVQKPDAQCTKEVNELLEGLKPGLKLS
jgi:hypothetical protein